MLVVPKCLLVQRDSWKPGVIPEDALAECLSTVTELPFAPSLKFEKLGRCCDFTFWSMQKTAQRDLPRGSQLLTAVAGPEPATGAQDDFTLVDSSKVVRQKSRFARRTRPTAAVQQQQRQQQQQQQQKQNQLRFHQRQLFQRGGKKDKLGAAYQQNRTQRWTLRARAMAAEYHVEVDPDWQVVCDLTLQSLTSGFVANPRDIKFEDVEWRGVLKNFDRSFDRITPKTSVPLGDAYMNRYSIVVPRARNDEVLTGLLQENDDVIAIVTDQLLAALLALPQSRYAWQVYAYRIDGKLILEKPDGSTLDLLTVNETSPEPPTTDSSKTKGIYDLGVEAAKTNCEFCQMTLENMPTVRNFGELPFTEESETPPFKAYRYRIITLPPGKVNKGGSQAPIRRQPIVVAVRTEVDGVIEVDDQESYVAVHALNEYTLGGKTQGHAYAEALERRRGDLFITELKHNSCKMAKWVYSAMIAGVSHLKVGFISKKQNKYTLLAVQTLSVQTLAMQMGLKIGNAWGIVREVIDTVLSNHRGDGQYIITRDPIQSQIKIHFKHLEKADFSAAVSDDED